MKKALIIAVTALLLSEMACAPSGTVQPFQVVGTTMETVRAAFNKDVGKVRVVMLVSPTCGMCLNGAAEVSQQVARIDGGKKVPLYAVWVPRLGGQEKDVSAATRVVADPLTREYWDGNDLLGVAYRQVLGWKDDNAWDVYMLYGPKARWTGDLPPAPDFYMHQDAEPGLRLNASVFGARVKELLRN
jgi:hypothetical protein